MDKEKHRIEALFCNSFYSVEPFKDDGICLDYDRKKQVKELQGESVLKQLRELSIKEKLERLEKLDMRSQVFEKKPLCVGTNQKSGALDPEVPGLK